jgi:hypothetical protein
VVPYYEYRCKNGHITLIEQPTKGQVNCLMCGGDFNQIDLVSVKITHVNHGVYSSYAHGCHCDQCKEANRIYQQQRRRGNRYPDTTGGTYRDRAHQDLVSYMERNT